MYDRQDLAKMPNSQWDSQNPLVLQPTVQPVEPCHIACQRLPGSYSRYLDGLGERVVAVQKAFELEQLQTVEYGQLITDCP